MPSGQHFERVLIAGCGDVGSRLGRRLAARGHAVWGLRRRPDGLPASLRPLAADLGDASTLRDLPSVDLVVYTAAAGGFSEEAYRRAYVEGLENLIAALGKQATPPRRLFFTSSTAVYGQTDGGWVDEDSPTEPRAFNGRWMLEAERRACAAPWPATVVRLAGIYGPGRVRLVERVRTGEATLPAEPSYLNLIHSEDAAGALEHLIGLELAKTPPDSLYVGVDEEPVDRRELLRWLARELGVPEPEVAPADATATQTRGAHKRCRGDRLRASGYAFRFPTWCDGYPDVLASL